MTSARGFYRGVWVKSLAAGQLALGQALRKLKQVEVSGMRKGKQEKDMEMDVGFCHVVNKCVRQGQMHQVEGNRTQHSEDRQTLIFTGSLR